MKKQSLTLFTLILAFALSAQQDAELQKRYWHLRDNLKKKFMKIGMDEGESLPFMRRNGVKGGYGFLWHEPGVTMAEDESSINYGADNTIELGWYIYMLAAEHHNLTEAGENTDENRRELWYALNALNRLDIDAEANLSGGQVPPSNSHLNGFLLRDDAPLNISDNWGDRSFDRNGDPINITAHRAQNSYWFYNRPDDILELYYVWDNELWEPSTEPVNQGNTQSIDQLTSLFTGLVGVKKLLPENANVLIPETGETKNLQNMVTSISNRIFGRLDQHDWIIADWDDEGVSNYDAGGFYAGGLFAPWTKTRWILNNTDIENVINPGNTIYDIINEYIDSPGFNPSLNGMPAGFANTFTSAMEDNSVLVYAPSNSDSSPEDNIPDELQGDLGDVGRVTMEGVNIFKLWLLHEFHNNSISLDPTTGSFHLDIEFKVEDKMFCINGKWRLVADYYFGANTLIISSLEPPVGVPVCLVGSIAVAKAILPILGKVLAYNGYVTFQATAFAALLNYENLGEGVQSIGELIDKINSDFNQEFEQFEDRAFNMDNVHIMMESATVSKMWGYNYTAQQALNSELYFYPLIYKFLHENSDNNMGFGLDKAFYQNIVASLPCEGQWADPYDVYDPDDPIGSNPNAVTSGWASGNRFLSTPEEREFGRHQPGHPGQPNEFTQAMTIWRGEFNNISWMVYYNMYYSLWKDEIEAQGVEYKRDIECDCVHDIVDENVADITFTGQGQIPTFAGTQKTLEAFFPDYNEKGIYSPNILSRELIIDNNAEIDLDNDLLMCLPTGATPYALTIRSGSVLDLKDDHVIDVCEGCEIRV